MNVFLGRSLRPRRTVATTAVILLEDFPPGIDPCMKNGEFHTFYLAGSVFGRPIPVRIGDVVERDEFWFGDLTPEQKGSP